MAHKRSRKDFEADLQKRESPFVVYGTPLPPLDEDSRDDGSYVPVWKQEVTDDRGRKRLHGAFTGGFSAGYFNTVGSKEGWAPSTFVSSRTNRAKDRKDASQQQQRQQRPEDFMDEEDIREQEESRHLSTTDEYSGFGTENDPMHRDTLMDLFRPVGDSIGIKLLNKMGWKQGQGIGPRVKRRADVDDENSETHLFAPDDAPMITFSKKKDFKGLGFEGLPGLEAGSKSSSTVKNPKSAAMNLDNEDDDNDDGRPGLSFAGRLKKQKKPGRGGFGVGILNDTGSDEEDPYSMGPKISYNKSLGGDKKGKKKPAPSIGTANPLLKKKPVFISKKLSSMQNALRKCHDGRLPLTGFVLADELDSFSNMSIADDKYKPPEIPPGWRPAKAPKEDSSGAAASTENYRSTAEVAKASTHTASSRADLLGESRLPGKSVFDFLSPAARERLIKATGKSNLPPALSEQLSGTSGSSHQKDGSSRGEQEQITIPYLDPVTAASVIPNSSSGGFVPYAEDLPKRDRYKLFLEISAGLHPEGTLPAKPPAAGNETGVSDEDWLNELHEFVRAAEVFRPMSGAIASRFTSSSSSTMLMPPDSNSATVGEGAGADGNGKNSENLLRKPTAKPEDPAEVAAKLGMFGVMTRSVSLFQPTRLICKRFGVDMPVSASIPSFNNSASVPTFQGNSAAAPTAAPLFGQNTDQGSDTQKQSTNSPLSQNPSTTDFSKSKFHSAGSIRDGKEVQEEGGRQQQSNSDKINPDINEALEKERPGQELFKAIFGDDDDDDSDEE